MLRTKFSLPWSGAAELVVGGPSHQNEAVGGLLAEVRRVTWEPPGDARGGRDAPLCIRGSDETDHVVRRPDPECLRRQNILTIIRCRGPLELCSCWVCGGQHLSVFRETYVDISADRVAFGDCGTSDA